MSMGDFKGNFRGRSDYKARGKGSTESCTEDGDKGIPGGINQHVDSDLKKGVDTTITHGDKGIPPMNVNPTAKPFLD